MAASFLIEWRSERIMRIVQAELTRLYGDT